MEYEKRSASGDAGEYLAAYKLTKLLGWPCRLYGVDIGVDAELEVLDSNSRSHGDIIKVQIKAISAPPGTKELSVYVDARHIEYWQRFCLPVIVCCVDLEAEKIYWRQITATEAFLSGGDSRKVTFDRSRDELSAASKDALERLVQPPESKSIQPLMAELEQRYSNFPVGYLRFHSFDKVDEIIEKCDHVDGVFKKLDPVLAFFPWRISSFANARLNQIRDHVRHLRREASMAYTDLVNGG
ncbi:DUF4365 domain-containing protein [Roseateles noduli]|uniref:DUF4365 domain-containing protein n=1 Tax=Roseateles noduli TaxID=2052484 RepID=UPI003D659BCE